MKELHDAPEWFQWLVGITLIVICFVAIYTTVRVIGYWTYHKPGPVSPPLCSKPPAGVRTVITTDDKDAVSIVCNNGNNYQP